MNEEVKTVFHYNNFVLNKNIKDISQEESLRCPAEGGNCMNWILGHVVVTRDFLHEVLGIEKMCDEKIVELYIQGAKPIDPKEAEETSELLKIYNDSQNRIMKALDEKNFEDNLEQRKNIAGFGFHEAYHVGQTGILRRIIGKETASS